MTHVDKDVSPVEGQYQLMQSIRWSGCHSGLSVFYYKAPISIQDKAIQDVD